MESEHARSEAEEEKIDRIEEEEEDPYSLTPEDIYDTVDENNTYSSDSAIYNRPPAPIPRPELGPEPEQPVICRGTPTMFALSAEKYIQ